MCLLRFTNLKITIRDFSDFGSSASDLARLNRDEKAKLGVAIRARRQAKNMTLVGGSRPPNRTIFSYLF
jgi:hypothetical protein